jgi:hypothetical protein
MPNHVGQSLPCLLPGSDHSWRHAALDAQGIVTMACGGGPAARDDPGYLSQDRNAVPEPAATIARHETMAIRARDEAAGLPRAICGPGRISVGRWSFAQCLENGLADLHCVAAPIVWTASSIEERQTADRGETEENGCSIAQQ